MPKQKIKVSIYDHYDKVQLAAQRIALIEKALLVQEAMFPEQVEDLILSLADDENGVFILENFDGFSYRSSGRVRVQFEYDDLGKKVVPTILYELT